MKNLLGIHTRALFLACSLSGLLEPLHAEHTAYVFKTDTLALPAVLTNTIKARVGNDAVIVVINPDSSAATIKGVPVKDMGAVAVPRWDPDLSPAGVARHFAIMGDLTLLNGESIWGWGDRL